MSGIPAIGDRVRIVGGFEDGLTGVVVTITPHVVEGDVQARPNRYRVKLDDALATASFHLWRVELVSPC